MIGASGIETEQRYLQPSQVPGLFNSSIRGATAFYTRRLSRKHYIGATYQFQQVTFPSEWEPKPRPTVHSSFTRCTRLPLLSLSLFGGPQHNSSPEIRH